MKKIFALSLVLLVSVFLSVSVGMSQVVSADGTIVMKLANANPPGDVKDLAAQKFAELVNEKTGGRVQIKVYSGGQLGDWRDTIEGLGLGIDEIVIESLGTLQAYSDYANIDAVPYLYNDYEHFMGVWDSSLGDKILQKVGDAGNFSLFGPMYRGVRITTSKKEFSTLDEIKGLKIRVPNIQVYVKTWEALGATPTPVALTETFTALQQGTVDAQENPIIASYNFGFYDVAPYLILTNHVYSTDLFIFDRDYFNSLPQDIQEAIKEAANETATWRSEYTLEIENEFIQKFKDQGVEVVHPDLIQIRKQFDGFVNDYFPYLDQWVEEIKAVK